MIIDLGLIDYGEAYRVQKEMVGKRKAGEIEDSIIIAEHYPVFTIGRTGKRENIPDGIKVLRVDRGGDITFHGAGQLVVYPILDLRHRGRDLHRYLRGLEEVIIGLLREYGVTGYHIYGKTGVWVDGKKIASIGIGSSGWVTYHGLSLNVNVDLSYFKLINPCGMRDVEMTSLADTLNCNISLCGVKVCIIRQFSTLFDIKEHDFAENRYAVLA